MRRILITIFIALWQLNASALESRKFRQITINDGLAHTDGTCIFQDKIGFIWIGTNSGIQRFDGKQLKLFINNINPLRRVYNNRITAFSTQDNLMWIGSEGGLHCFDLETENFLPVKITDAKIDLTYTIISHIIILGKEIFLSSSDNIYVGTYNKETQELNIRSVLPLLKSTIGQNLKFYDATTDQANKIWIGSNHGIIKIELDHNQSLDKLLISKQEIPNFISNTITQIELRNHLLWMVSGENIEIISLTKDDNQIVNVIKKYPLKDYFKNIDLENENLAITKILIDQTDNLWIATAVGLIYIENPLSNTPKVKRFAHNQYDKYSISGNHCSNLFIDKSNCLWIGTWGGGISYIDLEQKDFHVLNQNLFAQNSSLNGSFVRAIGEDPTGEIWIGTRDNGINLFNPKTEICRSLTLGEISNKTLSNEKIRVIKCHDNKMYIGTTNGLNIIDLKSKSINYISQNLGFAKNKSSAIFDIAFDSNNQIWLATWGGGIGRIRIKNGKPEISNYSAGSDTKYRLSSDIVNTIMYDSKKNAIWATTTKGINRLNLDAQGEIKNIVYYQSNNSNSTISSDYVWPLIIKNDTTLWIGTLGGGLNKVIIEEGENRILEGKYRAEVFDAQKGCPSNDVESILTDDNGKLWIGGKGLSRFDPEINEFWNFDINDGLQGNSFKIGAACKSADGTLYFGGTNGLNYFNPSKIKKNKIKPLVAFSSFKVFGKEIPPSTLLHKRVLLKYGLNYINKVELKYNENDFSILFAALHFANPEKCKFKYQLKGYDENWKYINNEYPVVNYSNLKYGTYTFKLDASNNDGIWNEIPIELTIRITPPWWQSNIALLLYFIMTLVAIYLTYFYSIRWFRMKNDIKMNEANEKRQEELMQLKLQFFTNISHEFKTPLTLILLPLEKLKSDSISNDDKHKLLNVTISNTRLLLKLINELIEFRTAEVGKLSLHVQESDVFTLMKEIAMHFQDIAKQKNIQLKIVEGDEHKIWFDPEKMTKIIFNLISNSIKFTDEGGEIELEVLSCAMDQLKPSFENHVEFYSEYKSKEYTFVRIKDNGVGITAGSISQIFDRFFHVSSGTNKHLGSGIGLALVKSLVMLHHGVIQVSSEREKGTEILVGFPNGEHHFTPEEKLIENESTTNFVSEILADELTINNELEEPTKTIVSQKNLPMLLIVEDNDQLRTLLADHYLKEYKIYEAKNGEEGLNIARKIMPDLIISDIMMPKMNGIEMCKALKDDLHTCHIPLILLTAKSSIEQQIEGTQAGADLYISKPFSLQLLDAQIKRLMASLSALKEKYASDVYGATREIVQNSRDQEFMDRIIEIINQNIDNNDFNVNIICQELGLGRTNLYKKIKSITGNSLGEFIRILRLKKAAKLLVTQDLSISEVIFMVGINSNSYFTKAFKAQFGVTPSEFVNQQRKNEREQKNIM